MRFCNTQHVFHIILYRDVHFFIAGQAVKDLLVVHLAGEASKLVVFADSEIRAVPLHHCDSPAAATCRSCVALQDPHCAWDATANLCVAVLTKLHDNADKTLFQDIPTGRHRSCGHEPGTVFDVDYIVIVIGIIPGNV